MLKKQSLKFASAACALGAVLAASVAMAGTEVSTASPGKSVVEEAKKSFISGDLGVAFTSEYLSRGLVLENQGIIAQPYADLYFKLYEGTGFINSITLNLGIWSSIHSHVQGTSDNMRNWYEFDWTPGVSVVFAKNFTLTLSYFEFDSPADAFNTAKSINGNLAFNDSDILGPFALHPHIAVLYELGASGAAGLDMHGWYFEFGIAPSYTISPKSTYPITLTFPATVGLGDGHKFYGDQVFGYVSTGASVAVPLAFIPSGYGAWTLTGGYTYYWLGDNVANATDGGRESQHVFSGSIGLTF